MIGPAPVEQRMESEIVWEGTTGRIGKMLALPFTILSIGGMAAAVAASKAAMPFRVSLAVGGVMGIALVVAMLRHAWNGPTVRLTLDTRQRMLRAENLRVIRGFLPGPRVPVFTCAFDDVLWVREQCTRRNRWLRIRCTAGELRIDDLGSGYVETYATLCEITRGNPAPPSTSPAVMYLLVTGIASLICALVVISGLI